MQDRRFEPRRPTHERIELSWIDPSGAPQALTGTLRDVSRSGAGIRADHPIRINAKVSLAIRGKAITATVVSCVRVGPQCQVGLEFDPEFHGTIDTRKVTG